jgi:hypothetical protein
MMKIRTQQEFSKMVADLFGVVIKNNYPNAEDGVDIGSYTRGTNTDVHPDIDLLFLGLPHDPQRGFVDWTELDTFEMVHTWDGITDLHQIRTLDPVLFTTITQVVQQLQSIGANSQFRSVRAWRGDPGVVFTVSTQHPVYGPIEFDITLRYPKEYFGVEHARRFHHYLDNVAHHHGESRALQLLQDIRRLKSAV